MKECKGLGKCKELPKYWLTTLSISSSSFHKNITFKFTYESDLQYNNNIQCAC